MAINVTKIKDETVRQALYELDTGVAGPSSPALGAATGTSLTLTGNFSTSAGYIQNSVGATLTAAGTDRATALALTKGINNVTTAAASTGVTLPAISTAGIGAAVIINNAGANAIQVYSTGSSTIDGVAGATGVVLTNAKRAVYLALTTTVWISAQLGVVSA